MGEKVGKKTGRNRDKETLVSKVKTKIDYSTSASMISSSSAFLAAVSLFAPCSLA